MIFVRAILVVLCFAIAGAGAGYVFHDAVNLSVAIDKVCDVMNSGVRHGFIDEVKSQRLIDAALAAPEVPDLSKVIIRRYRGGCS